MLTYELLWLTSALSMGMGLCADITKASSAIGKVFTTIDRIPKIRDAPDGEPETSLASKAMASSLGSTNGHLILLMHDTTLHHAHHQRALPVLVTRPQMAAGRKVSSDVHQFPFPCPINEAKCLACSNTANSAWPVTGMLHLAYMTDATGTTASRTQATWQQDSTSLRARPEPPVCLAVQELQEVAGHISLRNVSFAYPQRKEVLVLKGFHLEAPAGRTLALVGPSGNGKSTIVSLIERFYEPLSGQVCSSPPPPPPTPPQLHTPVSPGLSNHVSGLNESEQLYLHRSTHGQPKRCHCPSISILVRRCHALTGIFDA